MSRPVAAGATHGDLAASPRARSSAELGLPIGDELRDSFVAGGTYWAAVGLLRDGGGPWFDDLEVRFVTAVSAAIAEGFRRAVLVSDVVPGEDRDTAPGVVVLDGEGRLTSISPQAEHWLAEIAEAPAPARLHEVGVLQAVAARTRRSGTDPGRQRGPCAGADALGAVAAALRDRAGRRARRARRGGDPAGRAARRRAPRGRGLRAVRAGAGRRAPVRAWVGDPGDRQHAAPLALHRAGPPESIVHKTGTTSRAELVGRVFLQHYVPRFDEVSDLPSGWHGSAIDGR